MLEKMDAFFAARLEGYDEHMLSEIVGSTEFYPYTASLLPLGEGASVLDLGCGTGLELEYFFSLNPAARVTGIDLSRDMLNALRLKFPKQNLDLIHASYFDVPFGTKCFDAAVSVESLHHFTAEQKLGLYRILLAALKDDGKFVLTDYFAESEALEKEYFQNLAELKKEQGLTDDAFYHYDTPLTVEHETEILHAAGFGKVRVMENWEATYTLVAER